MSNPVNTIVKLSGKPSADEQKLLGSIKDPQQRAMQQLQMEQQSQALLCTCVTNIAMMLYESHKAAANNLRF
jgi:hypothetical protein